MTFKTMEKLAEWLNTTKQTLNKFIKEGGEKPEPIYKKYLIKRKIGYILAPDYKAKYKAWKMENRKKQGRKPKTK
jgi:hypothetical protein